jgi:hypothetical protein
LEGLTQNSREIRGKKEMKFKHNKEKKKEMDVGVKPETLLIHAKRHTIL